MFIGHGCSQIFELIPPLEGNISFYILTLSWILISDMAMYLVLPAVTCSSVFLLAVTKASVIFFIVFTFLLNVLTLST